jgi:hypothetical protein
MATVTDGATSAARRAQMEDALAEYPHLNLARLNELIDWFKREATALDIGMIASNEAIAEPYRKFRADHIDPMTARDMTNGMLFATAIGVAIFLLIWSAI